MTDIHTQIRDNVERIKKGCKIIYEREWNLETEEYDTFVCGENGLCDVCQKELKTTIAENIKCANAMIEELNDNINKLLLIGREDFSEFDEMEIDVDSEVLYLNDFLGKWWENLNKELKKWQETKRWLEERQ